MSRVRGRRFDNEPKLNIKKVIAFIIAIAVVVMVFVSVKNLLTKEEKNKEVSVETTYFSIIENGKWGVIDNHGKYIINPEHEEMIIIPNNKKDIFICYENVDYNSEIYNTKVLNAENKEILTEFSNIEPLENYTNSKTWYEADILKYEKDGKYGLIDLKGKEILGPEYEKIYSLVGIEKSIILENNGAKGVLNSSLKKVVIEPKYLSIEALTDNYTDGYIVSNLDEKYGIIGSDGKIILECNYEKIQNVTGNNMYAVTLDGRNILVDSKEKEVFELGEKSIVSISTDNIVYKQSDKYGVINNSNESILNSEYEYIKFIFDKFYIAKKDGKYGIISSGGEKQLDFIYTSISYIESANILQAEKENGKTDLLDNEFKVKLEDIIVSEININKGYLKARVEDNYKYYNFKFEEKTNFEMLPTNTLFLYKENGKYGYVNKNNEKIVDPFYDDAKEQNEYGYCAVKKDGLWGAIKSDGTVVVEPSINLEENLFIDFVSNWYLYNDLNLNVYTK